MSETALHCDSKDNRKCYEAGWLSQIRFRLMHSFSSPLTFSGNCKLRIWVGTIPSQAVNIALISVIVIKIIGLLLRGIKHCTKSKRSTDGSMRAHVGSLPVRRGALAEQLSGDQGANSPDFIVPSRFPSEASPPINHHETTRHCKKSQFWTIAISD